MSAIHHYFTAAYCHGVNLPYVIVTACLPVVIHTQEDILATKSVFIQDTISYHTSKAF